MALALDQLRFRGEPAVIDLTSAAKMAEKVQEAYILCPEETVDAVLYSILMKSVAALSTQSRTTESIAGIQEGHWSSAMLSRV